MKTELLHLMKNDDRSEAIKAVLLSGLLPEPQLQQFLDSLTERALRRVLGLPGCSQWTGRAAWDAWAVKRLHSKDRASLCLDSLTERVIARTTKEAQQAARDGAAYDAEPIWAAAEAARASKSSHALEASQHALLVTECAAIAAYSPQFSTLRITEAVAAYSPQFSTLRITEAVAAYSPQFSTLRITEAVAAEREQQYQDLLSLINTMEV
jgi:hypothetical protein